MKKLFLVAITILIACAFTACTTDDKTIEEKLTQKKGWIITQATCSPDYRLNNGEWCGTDLLNGGFFFACEKDDIYYFKENKSFIRDFGKDKCTGETAKEENMGTWALLENDTWVRFYMTAYYDFDNEEYFKLKGIIKELDDTTLRLEVPIDETSEITKKFRGDVYPYKGTFYLTFKVK
jgi:hypothetical protein